MTGAASADVSLRRRRVRVRSMSARGRRARHPRSLQSRHLVVETRRRAAAHRTVEPAAERRTRADASNPESGDDETARDKPRRAAAQVRRVVQTLQRGAAARSARRRHAGVPLRTVEAHSTGEDLAAKYPGHFEVRRVSNAGCFRLHRGQQFLSAALEGEYVGLEEVEDGLWNIAFYDTLVGRFDEKKRLLTGTGRVRDVSGHL